MLNAIQHAIAGRWNCHTIELPKMKCDYGLVRDGKIEAFAQIMRVLHDQADHSTVRVPVHRITDLHAISQATAKPLFIVAQFEDAISWHRVAAGYETEVTETGVNFLIPVDDFQALYVRNNTGEK